MRSVLAPSFFTFKHPGIPFLLALGFHIVLSAISFAEEPRITVYGRPGCPGCDLLKSKLNMTPADFGVKNVFGADVKFVDSSKSFPTGGYNRIPAM